MANFITYPHTNDLVEAFQANEIKFAFCNKTEKNNKIIFSAVHPFVKCREYFNELLMINHHKDFQYVPIHGFKYLHEDFPLDLDGTRIALKFPTIKQKDTFIKHISWLHKVEDVNGVDHTIIHENEKDPIILIVEGSKMWMQKCILLNIYTLLLKLCSIGITENTSLVKLFTQFQVQPSELTYINLITIPKFNSILENCTLIADLPTRYVDGSNAIRDTGEVHAFSGIITINTHTTKSVKSNLHDLVELFKSIFASKAKNSFVIA